MTNIPENQTQNPDILTVAPGNPLQGTVGKDAEISLPGDKSLSHRAALFAALADGDSRVANFLVSGVTEAMLKGLSSLGVEWYFEGDELVVKGKGIHDLNPRTEAIDCGNSATTMRLLAGAIAAAGIGAILDGSAGLRKRPMSRIVDPLRAMGVFIESAQAGTAPLKFSARPVGRHLLAIDYRMPMASAQVKTCLILAGLAAEEKTILREPGPSRDHTERMLVSMGVDIKTWYQNGSTNPYIVEIKPLLQKQGRERQQIWKSLQPINISLPADFSSAAFFVVAGLITPDSEIILQGVGLNPRRTGLLDALNQMGAEIEVSLIGDQAGEPVGDIAVRSSKLKGIDVSNDLVVRMIDELPIFAIAGAYASGTTVVRDAQELRYKETDRIGALCLEFSKLGIYAQETVDGFIIEGGNPVAGGIGNSQGDHRLAMSLAIAGLNAESSVTVLNAGIINQSLPQFSSILNYLGARLDVVHGT